MVRECINSFFYFKFLYNNSKEDFLSQNEVQVKSLMLKSKSSSKSILVQSRHIYDSNRSHVTPVHTCGCN